MTGVAPPIHVQLHFSLQLPCVSVEVDFFLAYFQSQPQFLVSDFQLFFSLRFFHTHCSNNSPFFFLTVGGGLPGPFEDSAGFTSPSALVALFLFRTVSAQLVFFADPPPPAPNPELHLLPANPPY